MKKRIGIFGSTGSIGTQALDVIEQHSDTFEVSILTANNNVKLLAEQAIKFQPDTVVIANKNKYPELSDLLSAQPIKIFAGQDAIEQVAEMQNTDMVLTAMVGFAGLKPTIRAIKSGKDIALANKETLVVAGDLITKLAHQYKRAIVPVDSEHSAIFQCLVGEDLDKIEKIVLTASGGPFRTKGFDFLQHATKNEALKHPNWDMGQKITIDSASMMNKGLEVIEAKWLFGLRPDQMDVVVHPQSIVHSLVQFIDGSMKAQMGLPDMKLPIQYAFAFPERIHSDFPRLNFIAYPQLTFEPPDVERFRNLALAYDAMNQGGNMPCILNAANEIVVDKFLRDEIGFLDMPEMIEKAMQKISFIKSPDLDSLIQTDAETRNYCKSI